MEMSMSALPIVGTASHLGLLSTGNVASLNLNYKFYLILINFKLRIHIYPA